MKKEEKLNIGIVGLLRSLLFGLEGRDVVLAWLLYVWLSVIMENSGTYHIPLKQIFYSTLMAPLSPHCHANSSPGCLLWRLEVFMSHILQAQIVWHRAPYHVNQPALSLADQRLYFPTVMHT